MEWKNRLRNYGLWVAVAALIPLILQAFGVELVEEQYNEIVNSLLGILVLLGLISNPDTENRFYMDDEENEKDELE